MRIYFSGTRPARPAGDRMAPPPPVAAEARAATEADPLLGPALVPQACPLCGARSDPAPEAVCGQCLGPLEPVYDPGRRLPSREEIARRPPSLWRYREWL